MHKTVLMHADIHERAEIDHVAHRAHQLHAGLQILDIQHVRAQNGLRQILTRIAAGLLQLGQDILQGRQAKPCFPRQLFQPVGAGLLQNAGDAALFNSSAVISSARSSALAAS